MIDNPFFSVITPVFNGEKNILKCITSVASQNFCSYEHIIIDGESRDNTTCIIRDKITSKIKFISEPDEGVYDAMNKGIKLSKGKWLYFLGCDDFFANTRVLSEVYEIIHEKNYQFVYGNVFLNQTKLVYDGKFNLEKLITRNISHQSIFYSRNTFELLGLYNIKYKINADYEFNIKCMFDNRIRFRYINKVITCFNQTGLSKNKDELFNRNLPKIFFNILSNSRVNPIKKYYITFILLLKAQVRYNSNHFFSLLKDAKNNLSLILLFTILPFLLINYIISKVLIYFKNIPKPSFILSENENLI